MQKENLTLKTFLKSLKVFCSNVKLYKKPPITFQINVVLLKSLNGPLTYFHSQTHLKLFGNHF